MSRPQVFVQWTGIPLTTCCHVMAPETLWSLLWEEQRSPCTAHRAWTLSSWRIVKASWGWLSRRGERVCAQTGHVHELQHKTALSKPVVKLKRSFQRLQLCLSRINLNLDYSQKGWNHLRSTILNLLSMCSVVPHQVSNSGMQCPSVWGGRRRRDLAFSSPPWRFNHWNKLYDKYKGKWPPENLNKPDSVSNVTKDYQWAHLLQRSL